MTVRDNSTRIRYYRLFHAYRWARHYHDATDCDANWTRAQICAHAQALRLFCDHRGQP